MNPYPSNDFAEDERAILEQLQKRIAEPVA